MCAPTFVPLRVPMVALTDAFLCGYKFELASKGWPRAFVCEAIFVSLAGELSTLRISFLIRVKVGFAVARAHPERIASAEQGRGCNSYCRLLPGVSLFSECQ